MTPLGQSAPHDSAREHVRGEAIYIDDMPPAHAELIVDFVGSAVAHGRITNVDIKAARACAGIVAVFTWADVPENSFGPVFHDEELLAKDFVHYVGQPIVVIAGETRAAIAVARKRVAIAIDPLPPVLSIEEAIARQEFIGPTRRVARGDFETAFASSPHQLKGDFHIGGQEHFYLESQAAIAIPGEAGQITIHSSTQHPSEIQAMVARCLKRQYSQIVCVCRRMGGGFGGKETQAAGPAIMAALVANRTRRPARIVLQHEQDFHTTGKRHPYRAQFEVGFDDRGVITALKTEFHSNGGFSADLSLAVMERTLLHAENAYYLPNVEFIGTVCKTNLPSNTAFRGFGGPQGVAAMENVIEEVAAHLGIDAFDVRRRNIYGTQANNSTPYGQIVQKNTLPAVIDWLAGTSDYDRRRSAAIACNKTCRTHLRGIALTPVKFGISFTRRTLNQGNALVNVFLDGTVQVSTGGTEMGQGLFIKIQQIVADRFGIPLENVRMMPTSTEKNNNTSPTAASAGTDLNGSAALRACDQIAERLARVAADKLADDKLEASAECMEFANGFVVDRRQPTRRASFRDVVTVAYEQRVDLGARGFYATPGVDFNRETGRGTPFLYYTNGAAVAEVLIDRFTGELKIERIDLLMDLGRMINPAIDRGQVVGGFVQGMGWVTTEALVHGADGTLLSDSATTYKIPNATDVPEDFRVNFLDNDHNTENVHASKAVGEPPLLLAISVWAAVKQALVWASPGRRVPLNLPATNEEILLQLAQAAETPEPSRNGAANPRAPHEVSA